MNLLQLEYFQEVAKTASITQAAKTLGISQSALSIMMNKLEEEIGYPLLEKRGRNIALTPYGEMVSYYSYILLNEITDIQREFQELRGEENEWKVTLGITDSNYYGDWILKLLQDHPNLQLNILQMPRDELYYNLTVGKLDFGISNGVKYHEAIESQLLFSQPYQLLVLQNHPLAKRGYITMEEFVKEPLISLPPSHKNRLVDNLSSAMNFQPNIIFEGNADIMEQMFHIGVGSILTCVHNANQWMRGARSNYALLDIPGVTTRYEMHLVWMKNRYRTKCARTFQEYVFDYYHI